MNTCRTCLKTPAEKDILDLEKSIKGDNLTCIDIMVFCLNVKVTEDSKITTKICNSCFRKIISFYTFKILSLKNDAYLRSQDVLQHSEDQKISVYVDENGVKHENILDPDEFGPSEVELCNSEFKTEIENEDKDGLGEYGVIVKEEDASKVEYNDEPAEVTLEDDYENVEDDTKNEVPEQNREQQLFQCKSCPKQFLSIGGRKKHYRTIHLGKKSKCDICNKEVVCLSVHRLRMHNPTGMRFGCAVCGRRFVSRAVLELHQLSHTKDYRFQCETCQKKFSCKSMLSKHIRQIHEKERNHKCKHCPKAFFVKNRLQEHLRTHTNDSQPKERQICEECGMSVVNLKHHAQRHKPKEQRPLLQCKACPKMFYSVGGRKRHYKTTHLGKKATCDICNKQVVILSEHMRRIHAPDELRFACLECGRRCLTQALLHVHTRTHTRDYRHECQLCLKKFSTNAFLSMHKRDVHDKERNHQCEFCQKAFFLKSKLKDHLRKHTNERPFTCDECGNSFKKKVVLERHLTTHSGVRNYPCKLCSMSFKTPQNLRAHMVSHTKEKRYPCGFCGVRFGRSDHRNRHQLTAHKKHGQTDKKSDSSVCS